MYENFIRAIEAKGITPPDEIIADGEIHRFDSDHSGKSNGAYVLHSDEPQSGWFKCWKTGTENNWSRGYSETDPVKKEQFQKLIKQRTQERTVKILELQKNAAIKASTEYQDAKPADPDHPYLKRKQIKPYRIRQDLKNGNLIIPINSKDGKIISRQTINKEGDKYFLTDGQVKGGYFDLGESNESIVICEGFATGASIFEASGYRVRCVFNCLNLKEVAITTREVYPKAHIIIAGDDDHNTKGNPGRTKAIESASSIDASVVFPDFGENRTEKATDFNDLHCLKGVDAVMACFNSLLKKPINNTVTAINGVFEKDSTNGSQTWSVPKPLPDAPPPPPPLDPKILPQPFADFAKASALENEVSPEAVAALLLSSIGAVTGSRFCIKPDSRKKSWYEFPIRSTALVMNVSQNKSGVFRAAIGPLERLQRSYQEENDKSAVEYLHQKEVYDRSRKGLLSRLEKLQKDGEPTSQVEQELRNMIPPNVPDEKTLAITAGTRPKIIEILSRGNERGLLIKRDELAGWFAGLERTGNEGDREFYLEGMTVAFNYDNYTIGRGVDFTPALALSICGTIQKSKLSRLILDMEKGYRDDGMLQRFMWVCPQLNSFEDFEEAYSTGFRGVDNSLLIKIQKIFARLDALSPDDVGATNSDYSPAPWIGFDQKAQKEFLAWRKVLKKNVLTDENLSDGLESHLRKSERLVAGLALSFHALKCATTDNINDIPPAVDSDALNRAVDIWDVLRHHANAVYSLGQTSTLEAARLIYSRIRKLMDKDSKFSVRDIKQKKWRGINDDKLIDEVLELLVEKDIVKELETPHVIKGRPPSSRFLVNPLALKEDDV